MPTAYTVLSAGIAWHCKNTFSYIVLLPVQFYDSSQMTVKYLLITGACVWNGD